jgi:lipid-binding SYLF domain-containing protein
MQIRPQLVVISLLALLSSIGPACGQAIVVPAPSREAGIVDSSADVLGEIMSIPAKSIPAALLARAEGIAILPDMIKGGFIVGARHGRGVVVTRDEAGRWKPPVFVQITGASIGWQVGIQGTDLVLVFLTKNSLKHLTSGKFTIGANASAAAGPVGRDIEAATDARLKAEILSYSRSHGLFAGIALDGAVLSVDQAATNAYYQPLGGPINAPGQPVALPPATQRLLGQLAKYTPAANLVPGNPPPAIPVPAVIPPPVGAPDLRGQLAASSRQLAAVLDASWQRYLALPAEVYAGDRPPSAESLRDSLERFSTVAADPRYQTLAQRPEFRTTWSLLRQYSATVPPPPAQPLSLPPPPR